MNSFFTFCGMLLLFFMVSVTTYAQQPYLKMTSVQNQFQLKGIIQGQKLKVRYKTEGKRKVVKGKVDSIAHEQIYLNQTSVPIDQITFIRNKSEYQTERILGITTLIAAPITIALTVNLFANFNDQSVAGAIAYTPVAIGGTLLSTGLAGAGIILLMKHKNGYRIPDKWTLKQVDPKM